MRGKTQVRYQIQHVIMKLAATSLYQHTSKYIDLCPHNIISDFWTFIITCYTTSQHIFILFLKSYFNQSERLLKYHLHSHNEYSEYSDTTQIFQLI